MYPISEEKVIEFVNLNDIFNEENDLKKVRKISQIEKFNKKYNL